MGKVTCWWGHRKRDSLHSWWVPDYWMWYKSVRPGRESIRVGPHLLPHPPPNSHCSSSTPSPNKVTDHQLLGLETTAANCSQEGTCAKLHKTMQRTRQHAPWCCWHMNSSSYSLVRYIPSLVLAFGWPSKNMGLQMSHCWWGHSRITNVTEAKGTDYSRYSSNANITWSLVKRIAVSSRQCILVGSS